MKNQWPFWLFIIGVIAVVIFSLNYQQRTQVISLGDIFPEGGDEALDYEYGEPSQTATDADVKKEVLPVTKPVAVEQQKPVLPPSKPVVVARPPAKTEPVKTAPVKAAPKPEATPPKPETISKTVSGVYTIQVLSSKDQKALQQALGKVKQNGFSDAFIQSKDLGDKGVWYRIYIGQYTSMEQARNALLNVKKTYPDAYILKL